MGFQISERNITVILTDMQEKIRNTVLFRERVLIYFANKSELLY